MIFQQSIFHVIYIIAGAIACVLGWYVWRRRALSGGVYFFCLMALLAEWSFLDAYRSESVNVGSMLLSLKLIYIAIVAVPPLWLLFSLAYTQRSQWLTPIVKVLLFVVPVVTLAIVATNEYHGLMWSAVTTVSGPSGEDLILTYGPWFFVHAVYSYLLMFTGVFLMLKEFAGAYEKNRGQMGILMLAVSIPLAGNVIGVFNDLIMAASFSIRGYDISPIAFCISGILFTWGIFRYQLFDIMPVAGKTLIDNMEDGVLVLDRENRVVDMNPAARKLLDAGVVTPGQPIDAVLAKYPALVDRCREDRRESTEIVIEGGKGRRWLDVRVSPLFDDRQRQNGKVVALWDITGHKQIVEELRHNNDELRERERELQESEERWRRLVELVPASIIIHSEGKIIFVNEAGVKTIGASREEDLFGQPVLKFVHPDYQGLIVGRLRQMQETGAIVEPTELKILRLDGKTLDVETTGIPVIYMGRQVIMTVLWDIHERKQAGVIMEASLREKEMLLKEIHHRVKNNLQIISSLLSLQTASATSEESSAMMRESQDRIRSMALIHEKLYRSHDFAHIDFKDYIDSLIGSLSRSYVTSRNIRIVKDIENLSLDIDTAIPCGLIINELITNSLKYAFTDSTGQELRVSMTARNGIYTLTVSDDGVGLPQGMDFRNAPTLGLQLVVTLTGQLNGNIELLEGKGTTFKITFH